MITFKQFITEMARSLTSDEVNDIRNREGIKFSTDAGHPTQRSSTRFTYRKMFDMLPDELKRGKGLDYSAGLGLGSDLLRNEFGADIESYEPFPHEKAKDITYAGLNSLPDKLYDYIFNSAVLNVVEQDIRDAIVLDIWNHLKAGGQAIIGVRSASDVMTAKTAYVINPETAEIIDRIRGSYQKGFTPSELRTYIQSLLPEAAVTLVSGLTQVAVRIHKDEEYTNITDVDYEIPKKKHPMVRELEL